MRWTALCAPRSRVCNVGKFREPDGDEYDITLRLPMAGRQTLEALDQIQVATATGEPCRCASSPIAAIFDGAEPASSATTACAK